MKKGKGLERKFAKLRSKCLVELIRFRKEHQCTSQAARAVAPSIRVMAVNQLSEAPAEAAFLPVCAGADPEAEPDAAPEPVAEGEVPVVTFVGYALPVALTSKGSDVV